MVSRMCALGGGSEQRVARCGWLRRLAVLLLTLGGLWPLGVYAQGASDPYRTVRSLMARGDYETALHTLDSITEGCDTCTTGKMLVAQSLIALHRDLPRAEIILQYQPPSPETVLRLAEALHLQFRFEEARAQYELYTQTPDMALLSTAETQERIANCQNGQQLLQAAYRPALQGAEHVSRDSLPAWVLEGTPWYSIIELPSALMGPHDGGAAHQTRIAYPKRIAPGTRIVFPRRVRPNGPRDLYATELLANGLWRQPEALGPVVNTPYDESFAVLSEDGTTMYFSSAGLYGMGGQDIFYSRYDAHTQQWSPPENLGFPYNSPYNDYLLQAPGATGTVVLASDRFTSPDSLWLYTLTYDAQQAGHAVDNPEEISKLAHFAYRSTPGGAPVSGNIARRNQTRTRERQPMRFRDVEADPEYQRELSQGYGQQRQADSLRTDLEKLRERLWDARSVGERREIEARIVPVETAMLRAQRAADVHFVRASQIEQEYITGKRSLLAKGGSGATFRDDSPGALYQAQLAGTVFQQDELKRLAAANRLQANMRAEAKSLLGQQAHVQGLMQDSARTIAEITQAEQAFEQQAGAFSRRYGESVREVRGIYAACLAVALMKSDRSATAFVMAAEKKAQECYRAAQTLRNNSEPTRVGETSFIALVLETLGNDYMEIGYTYAWAMEAYRATVEARIDALQPLILPSTAQPIARSEATATPSAATSEPAVAPAEIQVEAPRAEGLEIVNPSPYTAENPVPRDEKLPMGVIYRLQLGAYSNPIDPELFRGMVPINAESVNEGKITKYYAGNFRYREEADKGKAIAAQCGFPDAFAVAWHNGRRIPLARAQALEKSQPRPEPAAQADNGTFQVLVGLFSGALPEHIVQTLAILAPGREVLRLPGEGGNWRYVVTGYESRNQAERLRDNLLASGLTEATVIAVEAPIQ